MSRVMTQTAIGHSSASRHWFLEREHGRDSHRRVRDRAHLLRYARVHVVGHDLGRLNPPGDGSDVDLGVDRDVREV